MGLMDIIVQIGKLLRVIALTNPLQLLLILAPVALGVAICWVLFKRELSAQKARRLRREFERVQ